MPEIKTEARGRSSWRSLYKGFVRKTASLLVGFVALAQSVTGHAATIPEPVESPARQIFNSLLDDPRAFGALSEEGTRALARAVDTSRNKDLYRFASISTSSMMRHGDYGGALDILVPVLRVARESGDLNHPDPQLVTLIQRWAVAAKGDVPAAVKKNAHEFVRYEGNSRGVLHQALKTDAAARIIVDMPLDTFDRLSGQKRNALLYAAKTGEAQDLYKAAVMVSSDFVVAGNFNDALTVMLPTLREARALHDLDGRLSMPVVRLLEMYKKVALAANTAMVVNVDDEFGERMQQAKAVNEARNRSMDFRKKHKKRHIARHKRPANTYAYQRKPMLSFMMH